MVFMGWRAKYDGRAPWHDVNGERRGWGGRKFGAGGFRVEGNLNLFKFGQKREARTPKLLPFGDRNVATEKSCRGLKISPREVMLQVRAPSAIKRRHQQNSVSWAIKFCGNPQARRTTKRIEVIGLVEWKNSSDE